MSEGNNTSNRKEKIKEKEIKVLEDMVKVKRAKEEVVINIIMKAELTIRVLMAKDKKEKRKNLDTMYLTVQQVDSQNFMKKQLEL